MLLSYNRLRQRGVRVCSQSIAKCKVFSRSQSQRYCVSSPIIAPADRRRPLSGGHTSMCVTVSVSDGDNNVTDYTVVRVVHLVRCVCLSVCVSGR